MRPSALVAACIALLAAGCAGMKSEAPGPDARRLAGRWPAPDEKALLAYRGYWCARSDAERAQRRAALAAGADEVELMLLEYCDLAHPDPPPTAREPGGAPLARWQPAVSPAELVAWQQFWCARDAAARGQRRAQLAAPGDDLELLLLDYCDNARRAPRAIGARLAVLAGRQAWPAEYAAWFGLLQWHLQGFAAASTEATAQQQHLQKTIDELRAIERDMSTRDAGTGAQP